MVEHGSELNFEELVLKNEGVVLVDFWAKYDIMSIPTLVVFKNGEPVETLVGFMPKDSLKEAITKHL